MNEQTQQTGLAIQTTRHGELASSASAAKAKAEVEARFVIALQRPRNIMNARAAILDACRRPAFAEGALYKKPVGGQTIQGLSIRFAEAAIQAMRNIVVETSLVWEDDTRRSVRIAVTDLESNLTYGKDVTISKTVERRTLKDGQVAISERQNSTGQKVFLVAATEDDIANKIAAAESKVIRNSGLRLIPQDILDEAEQAIRATLEKGGADPKLETKRVCDSFSRIGVRPIDIVEFLGHSLETVSPKELAELRMMFSAIRDGEAAWADYLKETDAKYQKTEAKPAAETSPKSDAPKVPTQTVYDKFADGLNENSITYSEFIGAADELGWIPDATSYPSLTDIPQAHITRLMRRKDDMIADIKRWKEKQ